MLDNVNDIHPEIKKVLDDNQIKDKDLYNRYSDLYIGCQSHAQATKIKNAGIWRSMSTIFTANKGSDMDHYPCCLEIAFGYINGKF